MSDDDEIAYPRSTTFGRLENRNENRNESKQESKQESKKKIHKFSQENKIVEENRKNKKIVLYNEELYKESRDTNQSNKNASSLLSEEKESSSSLSSTSVLTKEINLKTSFKKNPVNMKEQENSSIAKDKEIEMESSRKSKSFNQLLDDDCSFTIFKEDIVNEVPLSSHKIREYLDVDFGDGTTQSGGMDSSLYAIDTDFLVSSSKTETSSDVWVYVEGLRSGVFRRAKQIPCSVEQPVQMMPSDLQHGLKSSLSFVESLKAIHASFFLLCQGILAGGATFHLYYIHVFSRSFLCNYAAVADNIRQFFFILVNCIAVMVQYSNKRREKIQWESYSASFRILILLSYSVSFLLNLISSPTEIEITQKYQNDSTWCMHIEKKFESKLNIWKILTSIRSCGLMLGWMLLCTEYHQDQLTSLHTEKTMENQEKQLIKLSKRIAHLTAKDMENLSQSQLNQLVQTHQMALEETQRILYSKSPNPSQENKQISSHSLD